MPGLRRLRLITTWHAGPRPVVDDILVIDGARPSYSRAAYRLDETVESPGRAGEQGQEYPADPGRGQPVNLFSNVYKVYYV